MSQPPKSTILAPSARWVSLRRVLVVIAAPGAGPQTGGRKAAIIADVGGRGSAAVLGSPGRCAASAAPCIHARQMTAHSSLAIDVPDALLARARAGDRAAFEQLYRWFDGSVFTLALRIGGDREEARDVLQETMLKVFRRIGEFRGDNGRGEGSPFWGWLRQIAVNEALMRLR